MRKIILCFFFMLIFSIKSYPQFCGVNSNTPVTPLPSSLVSAPGPFVVRIFVHAISDPLNNLPSVTTQQIYTAVNILQQDFQSCGICFSLKGYDFISVQPALYYDAVLGGANSLATIDNLYSIPNCINIYIAPDILPNPNIGGGCALGIPSTAFIVGGKYTNPNNLVVSIASRSHVISHEMGHCLGLHHTHHGSGTDGVPGSCPELVNGSNGSTCGDYVVDTPAEPIPTYFCTDAQCNFDATCLIQNGVPLVDANGAQYTPDIHNIMSYTQVDCAIDFSTGQCNRSLSYIGNSSILQACLVPNDLFIQNITFNSGVNFYATHNTITSGYSVTVPPYGNVVSTSSETKFKSGAYVSLMPGFLAAPTSDYYFLAEIGNLCDPITQTNNARIAVTSPYNPFLNNTKWINSFLYIHGFINDYIEYMKDSSLLGNIYKQYSDTRFYLPNVYNDSSVATGLNDYYFFREDTATRKVFMLNPTHTAEILLYDFNLNIGDTLPVTQPIVGTFYLTTIDSVFTSLGFRKRFSFVRTGAANSDTTIWIEGIGNTARTSVNYTSMQTSYRVVCGYENNYAVLDQTSFLYPPVSYDCAGLVTSYEDISNNIFEKLDVYPNPFINEILFEATLYREQKPTIDIYDVMGNHILNVANGKALIGKVNFNINTSGIKPGTYICVMQSNYKKIIKKIVKL